MEHTELKNAALLALGALVAYAGPEDAVVIALARALKDAGSDSTYALDIVERADQRNP